MKSFFNSFKYAWAGIRYSFLKERNLRIHIIIMALVLIAGAVLGFPMSEMIMLVFVSVFVIIAEMINSAVERMVDLISPEHSEAAKVAKDVAAGTVLIAAASAVAIGIMMFFRAEVIEKVVKLWNF